MASKKSADLSSGLVAIKGAAAPTPDMPPRAAKASPEPASGAGEENVPLNFRIPASLRREFKTYAARHDMKLNELFRVAFEEYRRNHD